MDRKRLSKQVISLSLVFLFMISCRFFQPAATPIPEPTLTPMPTISPLEVRVGEWFGVTEFGSFTLIVAPDGKNITSIKLNLSAGITTVTSDLTPEEPGLPIKDDGSFEINMTKAQLVFRGQFSPDGTSASGHWEQDIPLVGVVSDDWNIQR